MYCMLDNVAENQNDDLWDHVKELDPKEEDIPRDMPADEGDVLEAIPVALPVLPDVSSPQEPNISQTEIIKFKKLTLLRTSEVVGCTWS